MKFSERLKTLRKEQNVTQEALIKAVGLSVTQYQRYEAETSNPTLPQLEKLADFFGVSIDYLVGRTPDNPRHDDDIIRNKLRNKTSRWILRTDFKTRLKELRKAEGATQTDMAEAINVKLRQYQNLESGVSRPSFETLIALANTFDISLDDLVGRSKEPTGPDSKEGG